MTAKEVKNIQDLIDLAKERGTAVKYQVVDLDSGDIIEEDYYFDDIKKSYSEAILQAMEDYDLDREEADGYVSLRVVFY